MAGFIKQNQGKFGRVFFSEEKNQKTFESAPVYASGIWPVRGVGEDIVN
jgi:hypothetical protein